MRCQYTFICTDKNKKPVNEFQLTISADSYDEAIKTLEKEFEFATVVSISSIREINS